MFVTLLVANVFMIIIEYGAIRGFVQLMRIPKNVLVPTISLLCILGAYGLNHRIFDVLTIFGFGIIGYFMKKWEFSTQPFIIGFLIGPMAELHFRRSLQYSDNSLLPFFTSPISCIFIVIAFVTIFMAAKKAITNSRK